MTRFVASQLAHDHWFSSQAAKSDLGYEPIASMEQCLEKLFPGFAGSEIQTTVRLNSASIQAALRSGSKNWLPPSSEYGPIP